MYIKTIQKMRSSIRGFTIVEAIVAVGISSIGVIGGITLINFMTLQNALEQERSRAHQMVMEEMELVQLDLFSLITSKKDTTIWDNNTPSDTSDDTVGVLEVVVRDQNGVLLTAAPTPAASVQVEVTMTWRPRGRVKGKEFHESVMTYIVP